VLSPEDGASEERSRFETLFGDLSSQFIRIDASLIDGVINDALKRLGELLDTDRAALTQLSDDGSLVFSHYWSRTGEPPPHLSVDAARVFPLGLARVMNGDVHCVSTLDDLPADSPDRDYLAKRNAKSAITLPLIASGRVIGSVGFATTRHARQWDAEVIARLRLVADVFASALARKRAEATLHQAVTDRLEFESLISDLSSEFVNLASDRVDGAIEDAQRRLVETLHVDRRACWSSSRRPTANSPSRITGRGRASRQSRGHPSTSRPCSRG
jgi:formate hydrogenlyase transcriptional activator